jgi:hypothetical protein
MSLRTTLLALMVAAAAASSACSVEDVPSVPTYQRDVKPILQSRCVRCHSDCPSFHADPELPACDAGNPAEVSGQAPFNGVFTDPPGFDSTMTMVDGGSQACNTIAFYATDPGGIATLKARIEAKDCSRMPPPPSDPLTDRQRQVFEAWLAEQPSPM